jgi:hypothetical protein
MNDDIDATDRRLAALHATMGGNLDALLDLDGGLREVLIAAQHRDLGDTLDHILDVDAGLQAIVPTSEQLTAAPTTDAPTSETTKVVGAVATLLMSLDTPNRLAIRNHPALDALASLFTLTRARLTARLRARALDRDRALALDLARALAPVLTLARNHDHDHDLAMGIGTVLAASTSLPQDKTPARQQSSETDPWTTYASTLARSAGVADAYKASISFDSLAATTSAACTELAYGKPLPAPMIADALPQRLLDTVEAVFVRRQRLTPSDATAVRLAALTLATEADIRHLPSAADAFRSAAAGITLLERRVTSQVPMETIIIARA